MLKKMTRYSVFAIVLIVSLMMLFSFAGNGFLFPKLFNEKGIQKAEAGLSGSINAGYNGQYGYTINGDGLTMKQNTPTVTLTELSTRFYFSASANGTSLSDGSNIGQQSSSTGQTLRVVTIIHLQDFIAMSGTLTWTLNCNTLGRNTSDQVKMKIESSAGTFGDHNSSTNNDDIALARNVSYSSGDLSKTVSLSGQYLRLTMEIWNDSNKLNTRTSNYRLTFTPGPASFGFAQGGATSWPTVTSYGNTNLAVGCTTKQPYHNTSARWTSAATAAGDGDLDYGATYSWGDSITRNSGATNDGELIMDQGGSGQNRRLMHWLTIPLSADITSQIAAGRVKMTFSAAVGNRGLADARFGIFIAWGSGSQGLTNFTSQYAVPSAVYTSATWQNTSVEISGAYSGITAVRVAVYLVRGTSTSPETELFAKNMTLNIDPTVEITASSYLNGAINTATTHGTLQIDSGSTGGQVTVNDKKVGNTVTLKAVPADGYYLHYWRKNSGENVGDFFNGKNQTYTIGAGDAFKSTIYWDAYFLPISTPSKTSGYTGYSQPVDAPSGLPSGFTANYLYVNKSGTAAYNSATAPANVGSYTVTITIKNANTIEVGVKNVDLNITKATPILTVTASYTYGQALQDKPFTYSAINPNNGIAVPGTIAWATPSLKPNITTGTGYNVTFTPDSTVNYDTPTVSVNVVVTLGASLESAVAFGPDASSNQYSFNMANTTVENGYARIGLSATAYTLGNYIFMGWQKDGSYISANPNYIFVLNNSADYTAKFRPVFARYTINESVVKSVTKKYDGNVTRAIPAVDLFEINKTAYSIDVSSVTYSSGTAPIAIGSHSASFTVTNTALSALITTVNIPITIQEGAVRAIVDDNASTGYNESIGWAHSVRFLLSVAGAAPGSVQKYIYSTDGGSSWLDVPNLPAATTGCNASFDASAASGSFTIGYLFKAVHNTYGTGVSKSVASTSETVFCKIDTVTPTIEAAYYGGYSGGWTNVDAFISITINRGASGAVILYSNDNINWHQTTLTSYNEGTGSGTSIENVIFSQTEEQEKTYYFKVRSGTGKETVLSTPFSVKVDKTKPTFVKTGVSPAPVSPYEWIGTPASVAIAVSDNKVGSPNSGIASIAVDNGAGLSFSGNTYAKNCIVDITDYRVYTLTVTDIAGNTATYEIHEKVDTKVPDVTVSGYIANTWTAGEVSINFTIYAGASGVRVLYSNTGASGPFNYLTTSAFVKENETAPFQTVNISHTFTEEQSNNYYFKVENGAGLFDVVDFGKINIDKTAPVITAYDTDLTPYQGEQWTKDYILYKFIAVDGHASFNSGVTSVEVDNDGQIINDGGGKYSFYIKKCTDYTITVIDSVGNSASVTVQANVDDGNPMNFTFKAYIGNTTTEYDFDENMWVSNKLFGDNAFVRLVFDMNFTASGVKLQYAKKLNPTANDWMDLTNVLREPGNENAMVQHLVYTETITAEQNNPYIVRMVSGSGTIQEWPPLGQMRIDFTAPAFNIEKPLKLYLNGGAEISESSVETAWRTDSVEARFILSDMTSGIKQFQVRKFAYDGDIYGNGYVLTETVYNIGGDGMYRFTMDTYSHYIIYAEDMAGNLFYYDLFPKIDKTSGFTLSVDAGDYQSATWIYDEATNVNFQFTVSGIAAFGPSGGKVEFSVNGGNNWITSLTLFGGTQSIENNGTLTPSMTASIPQERTYHFRVITGTGLIYNYPNPITVRKDIVTPAVTAQASLGGAPYAGGWVKEEILFTLDVTVGASGGAYYFAASASPSVGNESSLVWNYLGTAAEGVSQKTFTVTETTPGLYYYFKLVAGTERYDYTETGILVKIDKTPISANINMTVGGAAYEGTWTSGDVVLSLHNVVSGPSDYTVQYQSRRIGQEAYGALAALPEKTLTVSANTQSEYRFYIVGNSGMAAYTAPVSVKIDKDTPEFSIVTEGTQLAGTDYNDGWWVTDVSVTYIARAGESSYIPQYAVSEDGTVWSEWLDADAENNRLILTDTSISGGTIQYYKMRVLSGAGVSSTENNLGEVMIDTHRYSLSTVQNVGGVSGIYTMITNLGSSYIRGQVVESRVTTYQSYFIKSLEVNEVKENGDNLHRLKITDKTTTSDSFSVEFSGVDILVEIECYKEIKLIYNNKEQFLQGRTLTPVFVTVDEDGFADYFGNLDFKVSYNGVKTLPGDIGIYILDATLSTDSFILVNPAAEERTLKIVYYSGEGTEENPYMLYNQTDISYIRFYMNGGSDYDYLGGMRKTGVFSQRNHISLNASFRPVCEGGISFTGIYKGNNYKAVYNGTYAAAGDFSFFGNLGAGATVENLGVEMSIQLSTASVKLALLASVSSGAAVTGCYAIGNITYSGAGVYAAGLIAESENTTFGNNFADVAIFGSAVEGGFAGGMAGKATNVTMNDNYVIGRLNLIGVSVSDEPYYGAFAGYLYGTFTLQNNIYLPDNFSVITSEYDNKFFRSQSPAIGNDAPTPEGIGTAVFKQFIANITVYAGSPSLSGAAERTVSALSVKRIAASGIVGYGTDVQPFLVKSAADLAKTEIFPWGYFRQTQNVTLGAFQTLNKNIVFTGYYDGGSYSLINPVVNSSDRLTAIFGMVKGTIKNVRLVDIVYNVSASSQVVYIGGIAAQVLAGSALSNIIVSGTVNAQASGELYVGGITSEIINAEMKDCISLVTVNISASFSAVVGGLAARINAGSMLENLVSLARISAYYIHSGNIGSAVGKVSGANGRNIYNVSGNTYANGKLYEASIGENNSQLTGISAQDYNSTVGAASGILVNGSNVLTLISNLYPFAGGSGTYSDPFKISNYAQLLRIGEYMYANFELTRNITVGDFDGDGTVDAGYTYNFATIGKGAVFTGVLDGKNYSIYNLTDSLFEINAGQIRNITLNVYYAAYTQGSPLLSSDIRAHALTPDQTVVFGGVAKYNRPGSSIKMVIVNGEIKIRTTDKSRLKIGGIAGVATGGSILGAISYVNIVTKSLTADIGGIVGSVEGSLQLQGSIMTTLDFNIILKNIDAYGGVINAGLVVGALRSSTAQIDISSTTSAKVYINGVLKSANDALVGMRAFNS